MVTVIPDIVMTCDAGPDEHGSSFFLPSHQRKIIIMEINGTIINILELQTGEGRNGPWKKQEFILETDDQYPRKVCIALWGDKIDQFPLNTGEKVTVSINVESREFNGRWYTDVKAWKIDKAQAAGASSAPPPPGPDMEPPENDFPDDLPF